MPTRAARPRRISRGGFTFIELMTVVVLLIVIASIMIPRFWLARERSAYTACGQNLLNLAKSVAQYSNENQNLFPTTLRKVVPTYMQSMPTCPMVKSDTYTATYVQSMNPQAYTITCGGNNHPTITNNTSNQPYYTYSRGLGP